MPEKIIELLNQGTEANYNDASRKGNLICLPDKGQVIVTGDLHGNTRNFERICSYADLENNSDRHIIFQELIHGGRQDEHGGCMSYNLLFDAVRYKLKFPDQVHMLMGNHDTAFISGSEIMKQGKEMNSAMKAAINNQFPENSDEICITIKCFLFSQPLAARCHNRIWISHSLPSERSFDNFDPNIINRKLKISDMIRPASVYSFTWGRNHCEKLINAAADMFDVDIFILGHQPQSEGWSRSGDNLIIIASDHTHGTMLPVCLDRSYTIEQLSKSIIPISSIE